MGSLCSHSWFACSRSARMSKDDTLEMAWTSTPERSHVAKEFLFTEVKESCSSNGLPRPSLAELVVTNDAPSPLVGNSFVVSPRICPVGISPQVPEFDVPCCSSNFSSLGPLAIDDADGPFVGPSHPSGEIPTTNWLDSGSDLPNPKNLSLSPLSFLGPSSVLQVGYRHVAAFSPRVLVWLESRTRKRKGREGSARCYITPLKTRT